MLLYIDATAGLSGDRLLAACFDAGMPLDWLSPILARLPLPRHRLELHRAGAIGTAVGVVWSRPIPHAARPACDLLDQLRKSALPGPIQARALRVFNRLIQAEAAAHDRSPSRVYFHQLSRPDTLLNVVGFCAALSYFRVGRVVASSILLGKRYQDHHRRWRNKTGPAVRQMARGWPCRVSLDPVEYTTPTGAAIVTALATPGACSLNGLSVRGSGIRLDAPQLGATRLIFGSGRVH